MEFFEHKNWGNERNGVYNQIISISTSYVSQKNLENLSKFFVWNGLKFKQFESELLKGLLKKLFF